MTNAQLDAYFSDLIGKGWMRTERLPDGRLNHVLTAAGLRARHDGVDRMTFEALIAALVVRGYLRSIPDPPHYQVTTGGQECIEEMFRKNDEEIRASYNMVRGALSGVGG